MTSPCSAMWDPIAFDLTVCGRHLILDTALPSLLLVISLIYLANYYLSNIDHFKSLSFKGAIRIPDGEEECLIRADDSLVIEDAFIDYGATNAKTSSTHLGDYLKRQHFDIHALNVGKDDGTPHGTSVVVYRNLNERLKVAIEALLLVIQFVIHSSLLFFPLTSEWDNAPGSISARFLLWTYLMVIGVLRLFNINNSWKFYLKYFPNLWANSTVCYTILFVPYIILSRSIVINNFDSTYTQNYYYGQCVIIVVLFFLTWSATIGDKPVKLYKTNDLTPSPERNISLFSFVLYDWIDPMIMKAYRDGIDMKDIWSLRDDDYAHVVLRKFEDFKTSSRFALKLFKFFKGLFALQAILTVFESFLMFAPTYFLKKLLEYVQAPEMTPTNLAWFYLFLMFFLRLINTLSFGVALYTGRRICIRMKAVIIGEIYSKGLRRKMAVNSKSNASDSGSIKGKEKDNETADETDAEVRDLGGIINLMSVDAFKVSEICGYLHYFVSGALSACISIIFLYQLLGWSALVGAIAIIALLPVNYKISLKVGDLQKKILGITDKRIQKLNEALQSIRIIKFFTWESKFYDQIIGVRAEELSALRTRCIISVGGNFLSFLIPTFVTILSFGFFIFIQGQVLTTPVAFTSLSLFNLLRIPLDDLAYMLSFVIQSKVSLDRVNDFLDEPETTKYEQLSEPRDANSPSVGFQNASFAWDLNSDTDFKLRDLDISFRTGQLNVVIGATGSGKTSMLLALLGEMEKTNGKVFLPGAMPRSKLIADPRTGLTDSVAYCAQAAWLLNDSIKSNIVFAAPFNAKRYQAVVEACGLARDFEILEYGDLTEVGEKGITLSGGQKQRVSLARALYSSSKTILLDDCLSAVDSHTALWIYDHCITGPLMKGRTCILVSHNVALTVKNANLVVIMDNGRVKAQGTPSEMYAGGHLGDDELIKASIEEASIAQASAIEEGVVSFNLLPSRRASRASIVGRRMSILMYDLDEEVQLERVVSKANNGDEAAPQHNLIKEESKAEGIVGKDVYIFYAKRFGSIAPWIFLIVLFVGSQMINIGQSWWLRRWAADSETGHISFHAFVLHKTFEHGSVGASFINNERLWKSPMAQVLGESAVHDTWYYMGIYTAIGFIFAFICCLRDYLVFIQGIKASNSIFVELLDKVFRAKLRFFDSTPIGRIMNRFSRDIESIDQQLAPMAQGSFISLIVTCSTLVLIISITPAFFLFAIFIIGMFYVIAIFYLTLSRELKRYESISRSPIHQHFSETLVGVTTIRAYGDEHRFMRQNLEKIDDNNRPFFYLWVANRWLHLRVDTAGSFVSFFAGAFVILSVKYLDAGLAGLSLSYAISFTESALWIVRLYAEVEMTMNSVERLQEYLDIEQEPARLIPETAPEASWPSKGVIEVKDLSLRYAPELPQVIKNVSFNVESTSKVGIVGRTGAGKSTIITALFRFLDPETGFIKIDGVDITSIGLDTLRQAITIIPQDPTLFSGTIRSNLDPFDEKSELEIYEALRRVNLISLDEFSAVQTMAQSTVYCEGGEDEENRNKFLNLHSVVEEGGKNLSQGQRQLMCLARSLLRAPKVILLDEATASIDYNSDAKIQQTIRSEFSGSTILTIAHRLRSIIDYDKILVMDAGEVKEYADPWTLISDKSTIFYSMCANSGELETLEVEAKKSFNEKH
ncbi:bile acid-transporting ATPase [Saccharomycopsis crataegensis]|uniref:Bile acid-transporting ATPase n=1 Tax=Saccharomycopsis crataegensis TaxID=43959 RepID=A0AAV5QHP5_9ASCO|nr:bile acid-transporting ATPase [Saccharomycopsis crataegensis]